MNKYVIKTIATLNNSHINASTSNSDDDLRKNDTGLKAILKFNDADNIAREAFLNDTWYSTEEILEIITDSEWQ